MSATLALGAAAGFLAARALRGPAAVLARARGWVDPRPGAPVPERKRGQLPIPLTGGCVFAAALAAGGIVSASFGASPLEPFGAAWPAVLAALAAALAVGLLDDGIPGGLRPASKILLQLPAAAFAGIALAQRMSLHQPLEPVVCALLALVALELANTFDHADGLCAGGASLALAWPAPFAAAALAGWLPHNLDRRPGGAPSALLGDGGSHLIGVVLILEPAAWGGFFLPFLDLVRVGIERVAAGAPLWRGDRRHLGQRLTAAGLSPRSAAAWSTAAAIPAVAATWHGGPATIAAGLATSALAYAALIHRARTRA